MLVNIPLKEHVAPHGIIRSVAGRSPTQIHPQLGNGQILRIVQSIRCVNANPCGRSIGVVVLVKGHLNRLVGGEAILGNRDRVGRRRRQRATYVILNY
jgi:hypothetical protein